MFYKLETSKIDLSNYYAKNENVIPSSNNTYDLGSSSYTFKDIYLSGKVDFNGYKAFVDSSTLKFTTSNDNNVAWFANNNCRLLTTLPFVDNTYNLGSATNGWKDVYTTGTVYVNTIRGNTNASYGFDIGNGFVRVKANLFPYYDIAMMLSNQISYYLATRLEHCYMENCVPEISVLYHQHKDVHW